jgi:hypothetical protein
MGAWVDATSVAAGNFLTLNFNNSQQVFQVAGGTQGYIVCTVQKPVDLIVTTNNGAGVTVTVTLYNYNPLFTGQQSAAPINAGGGGGTTGGGTGGSGGGGSGYGGGTVYCFTGETRIRTAYGMQEIGSLPSIVMIDNATGVWIAELIVHPNCSEPVIRLPGGNGRVNLIHGIMNGSGKYVEAGKLWPDAPREIFEGTLYNLHIIRHVFGRLPEDKDKHFIVEPDLMAHNVTPRK